MWVVFPFTPCCLGHSTDSTENVYCYLLKMIKAKLDKQGVVGAVLHLRKAFDTVSHNILSKLSIFSSSALIKKSMYFSTKLNGQAYPDILIHRKKI